MLGKEKPASNFGTAESGSLVFHQNFRKSSSAGRTVKAPPKATEISSVRQLSFRYWDAALCGDKVEAPIVGRYSLVPLSGASFLSYRGVIAKFPSLMKRDVDKTFPSSFLRITLYLVEAIFSLSSAQVHRCRSRVLILCPDTARAELLISAY